MAAPAAFITDSQIHEQLRQALDTLLASGRYTNYYDDDWAKKQDARCDLMGEFMKLNQYVLRKKDLVRVHKKSLMYVELLIRNRRI